MLDWPVAPMKATPAPLPCGGAWAYEPKWDGHRALARIRPGGFVDVISSTGKPRIDTWPWMHDLATAVAANQGDWIVDGEVVAVDDDGKHSFQLVGRIDRPHLFVVFDLLAADGEDLHRRPWHERRARLEASFQPSAQLLITPSTEDGDALLTATRAMGFEGVIAKRRDSLYQPGRRATSWVKVKHRVGQEVVVGGYILGNGRRACSIGSLLVGVHHGGSLRFAGGIGSGFDDRALQELRSRLGDLAAEACPFDPEPKLPRGTFRWVRPELVVQAEFAEWTDAGHLRHAVYQGIRDDVSPTAVTREG